MKSSCVSCIFACAKRQRSRDSSLFGPLGYLLLLVAIGGAAAQSMATLLAALAATAPLVVAAWFVRRRSLANLKAGVLLLYAAVFVVTMLCLVGLLPAPMFWVVSAAVPAWKSWRLMTHGETDRGFRTLRYASRLFFVVATVAFWFPILLAYR